MNEFERILKTRHSCRAFQPTPLPRETIERMLALAQHTPSWCNTQPWQVHLVSGEPLERFRTQYVERVQTREGRADLDVPLAYRGEYQARRLECGMALYASVGITRQDKAAAKQQGMENYRFFGARRRNGKIIAIEENANKGDVVKQIGNAWPHNLARALMLEPKIVVLDEPVSALDVSIQAQVLNLLMDLQDQTRVAYVFISHNLAVVELIADEVLVMYLGKVVEQAPKTALFATPRHPYTRALLASTPRIDKAARQERQVLSGELPSPLNPPSGCAFHKRCPFAAPRCRVEVPLLEDLGGGQRVACHRVHEI